MDDDQVVEFFSQWRSHWRANQSHASANTRLSDAHISPLSLKTTSLGYILNSPRSNEHSGKHVAGFVSSGLTTWSKNVKVNST